MQSPRLSGSLVMIIPLLSCDLKSITITVEELKVADSSSPFLAILHLNASSPPISTDKSWNQSSKLPQVFKLLASAKPRVQRSCQNHYLQLNEKHFFLFTVIQASPFSIIFIRFHRVWGQKGWLDHLIWLAVNCELLSSYLDSPRWLWTQAFISSGNQTAGK